MTEGGFFENRFRDEIEGERFVIDRNNEVPRNLLGAFDSERK